MKKFFRSILTVVIFMNLYISLTFYWRQSESMFAGGNYSLQIVSLFLVILTVVIRHAQIIEVSYDISQLSPYMMGAVLLTLPQIKVIVDSAPSEALLCYLLGSLIIFEAFRLNRKGLRFSITSNALNLILLVVLIYIENPRNGSLVSLNYDSHILTIYIAFIVNISYSLVRTCISITPHVSDRMDLYSLAYFSVAGVLFNYCSEYLTDLIKEDIKNGNFWGVLQNASITEMLLFLFWLVVLIRVVQSLHLAALDYKDTRLSGIDLLVLTLFYVFISTFWLINSENMETLFKVLIGLSLFVSLYFFWMRFYRIQFETKINKDFDNRIQLINALTFAIIAASNYYLLVYGYNHIFILIQIFVLGFNIIHSYQLSMWIKFDLIFEKENDEIYFKPMDQSDIKKVAAYINYHFGYIYQYVTGLNKKDTMKLIYMLLKSSSRFGEFGRSRFFWAIDSKKGKKIGLIGLKASYNRCLIYNILSYCNLVVKLLFTTSPQFSYSVIKGIINNRNFLERLDINNDIPYIEVAYIVINAHNRNKKYSNKILNLLKLTNINSRAFYPEKKYELKDIFLIVRSDNSRALSSFTSAGFESIKNIEDNKFESSASVGFAQVMKCSVKEA